ncbi:MAG: tetratricopeptide repeat protein [Kofleriaceae bacterium]
MRGVLLRFVPALVIALSWATGVALADEPPSTPAPTKAPRTPGPDDATAKAILDRIVAANDRAARKAAIAELEQVAPSAVDAIGEWLARPRTVGAPDPRRAALLSINAAVPDKDGKFTALRQSSIEKRADDKFDWLPPLLALDPATPGVGEAIGDISAIRALAATKEIRAAQLVFDTAFGDTIIYRDECGRYLRKMAPYSIPALTRESQRRAGDRKRYATFQLERLDRQEANKALGAATGNEALLIAILDAFRETKHREAVHAVWTKVDDNLPRVREAARQAWLGYITGPPPPPAPKKKLQLPGGKETKKPKPLWLTYRELADNELRNTSNTLLHTDYVIEDPSLDDNDRPDKAQTIDLAAVTKQLFAYFDGERAKRDGALWTQAKVFATTGELAKATSLLDRLIAANPERPEHAEMAEVYFNWARKLEQEGKWGEASAAYSKAHGIDPKGGNATQALAAHHFMLGKALEAQGKDGGADFRRAVALVPDYAPAKTAADRVGGSRPVWMLYAAVGAGGLAMVLFAAAMMRRRRLA